MKTRKKPRNLVGRLSDTEYRIMMERSPQIKRLSNQEYREIWNYNAPKEDKKNEIS
jgi:hypothetical protein